MLDDLRDQSFFDEEEVEEEPRRLQLAGLASVLSNLAPWQRFVLSLFLFLDVALMGCMCLLMAGKVVPFR
jgi:hypothetical protein